jgi:Fic family protein
MVFDRRKPFNDLPPLPPKADVETKAILKKAIAAGRALAELRGVGGIIPNQAMLVNTLVLQEAKASSEIENVVTTNDALFRALTTNAGQVDPETKEVLRYREALWHGFTALAGKPVLSTNVFIGIAQRIKENKQGLRNRPGTVIANRATGAIIYMPPQDQAVIQMKLAQLEKFIHAKDELDPLIKMALVHYQFEAIHPFFDGNGRVGRIINILFLVLRGLLDLPVLYLSKYIIDRKPLYYRLLLDVTEKGEWESWVIFVLDAVESTSKFTRQRILDIHSLLQQTLEAARTALPRKVYSKELVELLFKQPYTKGQFLVDAGIAERQTAAEYLRELEKVGILRGRKVGRENLYLNVKLYDLLSK